MSKLSIRDLDLTGRRVFIRVDFNVPLENGVVTDDTRIRASLPTIQLRARARGHRHPRVASGRPKGQVESEVQPEARRGRRLAELLGRPVPFAPDCIGDAGARRSWTTAHARAAASCCWKTCASMRKRKRTTPAFARQLASLTDLYVNDAFGAAHRAHASVEAITHVVPKGRGRAADGEGAEYLGRVLTSPDRPLVAILGGAKVSDKLEVIQNFLARVDRLIIGGAMAYTFLKARGLPVGRSLVEDDKIDAARDIEARAKARGLQLGLPVDHVVAAKIEAGAPSETLDVDDATIGDRMGARHRAQRRSRLYADLIARREDRRLERPDGRVRDSAFREGHQRHRRAVADVNGTTIVGGGDSIAAVNQAGVADRITHISTGGGASLEFLGGRKLPGVEALADRVSLRSDGCSDQLNDLCEYPSLPATGRCSRPSTRRPCTSRNCAGSSRTSTTSTVVIAPPFTAVHAACEAARNSNVGVSAQNMSWEREGRVHRRSQRGHDQGSGRASTSSSATPSAARCSAKPT